MSESKSVSVGYGGCLGTFVAAFLSVKTWGWTWWLLLHMTAGWIYVTYWVIFLSGWIVAR